MSDELSRPFQDLVAGPTREQLDWAAKFLGVSRGSIGRIYALIQESAHKINAPGGEGMNLFEEHMRRLEQIFGVSGRAMAEGVHIPIAERPAERPRSKSRLLPWGRHSPRSLPPSEVVTGEIVSFIPPEEFKTKAARATESAVLLSEALISNILENYDYHKTRWKTELRRTESSHPERLLQSLLTAYIELNGAPDERLIQVIAEKTGIELEKWKGFVQRCVEENAQTIKADGVQDLLESRGTQKSGPER